jgi:branched-chain amino acid transport system substrate-binding protein
MSWWQTCMAGVLLIFFLGQTGCDKPPASFVCNDPLGCVTINPAEPIKLGVLQALSGEPASLGLDQIRGFELALAHRGGNILGHRVAIQQEDTGCSAEGGANAALKIIADPQVVAIFGTTCSGAAATAAHAISHAGLIMISGNNSAPFLTSIGGKKAPDWHAGYFRTAPNEESAGKAAAFYAYKKLHIRRAATINDGDIYTSGLTTGFQQMFQHLGGEIVLDTAIAKGDEDMEPVLEAVRQSNAKLLFFPLFQPEGNRILRQARKTVAFADIVLMSGGALLEQSFLDAVGEQGKGMYFVGPAIPSSTATEKLATQYRAKYKIEPVTYYYQSAYDAADLLFDAIIAATTRDKDNTLHIGHQAMRDFLHATKNKKGVTGSLSCNQFGDCITPGFNILRLDNVADGIAGLKNNIVFSYLPEK